MNHDLALVARQLQRETQAAEEAATRLKAKHKQACDNSYASSNIDSRKAISTFLEPIAQRIQKKYGVLTSGKAGMDYETIVKHLKDADPHILALLTMKSALDVLGKDPEPQLQDITTAIGKNVQLEIRLTYYAQENPELYKQTEHYFHPSTGTRQKATVLKLRFQREGIEWDKWSNTVNHKVGNWLLMAMNDVTGWIERRLTITNNKRKTRIGYTRAFLEHRDTILAAAESLAFCQWPMLCPPIDWTNNEPGGYLSETIRKVNPLVRKVSKVMGFKQGDIPLAMLNNLQHQKYRLNSRVMDVAEALYERRFSVGKFKCSDPIPAPEPLDERATEEEIKDYKIKRRTIENDNAQLSQRNWRTTEVMYVARKYRDDCFWMPASFDYRGRVYFLNTALNPQGTDFDKSLLYFGDEGPVDDYWLAFQVANTYGKDKETMADRIKWTRENHSLITQIATNPLGTVGVWGGDEVAEPWCFLAACIEYHDCVITGVKQTSGLPVGIDATCSGLQHLAAMTLCGSTAEMVNVVPTPKPSDCYRSVAEVAARNLDAKYAGWMNRKVTKRSVMTTPYGVTMSSARGYIRDELKKQGHREALKEPGVLSEIVKVIFNTAIPEVIPGPVRVMAWLKKSAGVILDSGKTEINWTTPSGFEVNQDLKKPNTVRVTTRVMGGTIMDIGLADGFTPEPDRAHHKSAIAPNVVHALDASLLHLTFAFWDKPFTVIHDCVMARSCDVDATGKELRLHFGEMYKAPVMQQWADQVGVVLPDDLIKNTLDIDLVNQSTYFFS